MQFGFGLGITMQRWISAGGGPAPEFTIPIADSSWTAQEASADADTRKTYATMTQPYQTEYEYGHYRGSVSAGNLTQIGAMTWDGTKYARLSVGQAALGAEVFNRLARRLIVGPGAWEWITSPFDTKRFEASNTPSVAAGSWAALSAGTVRVTLNPWDGRGRNVTSASYNRGAGATSFTPASAGASTVVDISGLTDGVDTPTTFTWTNVNGTSETLTLVLQSASSEAPPLSPEISYLIDGSGTVATVYLDPPIDFVGSAIQSVRYQIGAGSQVVVSGSGPIALTGLSATQTLTVEWSNASAYSTPVVIDLIASPPTYADANWTVADAQTVEGDGLTVTIVTPLTVPDSLALLETEYRVGAGSWSTLPSDGEIATGVPEASASITLRAIYDVGPSVPGNSETATPTFLPVVTDFPLMTGPTTTSTGGTSVTSHPVTLPAHNAGQRLWGAMVFDGNPTVTFPGDWTAVRMSATGDLSGNLYYFTKVAVGSSETLTVTTSASEQSVARVWVADGSREISISGVDENTSVTARAIDVPGLTFTETEKAQFILVLGQRGEAASVTSPPTGGWSAVLTNTSAANSAGVRLTSSDLASEVSSLDPAAWGTNAGQCTSFMVAFLPTAGVPPVTVLTTSVSSTSIENGQSVVFTAAADGRAPIDYDLTIEGVTYSQTALTNAPVTFSVTPSTGSRPWTLTAANASGSDADSGTITVLENLIYTVSPSDPFSIIVEADSVSHSVTPATYEIEWQTAAGGTATNVVQASPDFPINFPSSDAYRFRVRAINSSAVAGTWSTYKYYFAFQQGGVTWSGENAASIAISYLSPQAPIVVVPVAGRAVRVRAPLPLVANETWGSVVHTLNGVMYNPPARAGRGPQSWDSRTGDRDDISVLADGFSAIGVHSSWPQSCVVGDTFSKVRSQPSNAINSTGNGQGYRAGLAAQHSALIVMAAQPGATEAAPAIIKEEGWAASPVALPGMAALVAAFVGSTLSTSGMTLPTLATIEERLCRFDPTMKLLRGGAYKDDDSEALRPYLSYRVGLGNYYAFEMEGEALCYAMADGVSSTIKTNIISHLVMRGIQQDFPGNDYRVGAGISLDNTLCVMLSRIARGLSFDELATSQREIVPYMYDFWTSTTAAYLSPHDDITKPIFSRWKTPTSITTTASGYDFVMPFNINTRTGERKQSFSGLEMLRESTGERLPWGGGTGRNYEGPTAIYRIAGFFAAPPTTLERYCLQIPTTSMAGFAVGQPYWMYDTETSGVDPMAYRWNSFNPSSSMSYRDIPDPAPILMAGHLLGVYPAGVHWQAAKAYRLRAGEAAWPSAAMNYTGNGATFTGQFFAAHAATLGITL